MADVTQILSAVEAGHPQAAAELLPLVCDELRRLAAARTVAEKLGRTLHATARVHEADLRLVGGDAASGWNGRGPFFAAAVEAMRRIRVDQARRKQADKYGGQAHRAPLDAAAGLTSPADELLDNDEAPTRLAAEADRLVQLRYFGGLSIEDAAGVVGSLRSTAPARRSYARARLRALLDGDGPADRAESFGLSPGRIGP